MTDREAQSWQLVINANNGSNHATTTAITALHLLPDARWLDFRRIDMAHLPNLEMPVNMQAAIGYTVGERVEPPCAHCAAGRGQFPACVRGPGFFELFGGVVSSLVPIEYSFHFLCDFRSRDF